MKMLGYAWGLPMAAAVFWLGTLVQSEQATRTVSWDEWAAKVDNCFRQQSIQIAALSARLEGFRAAYKKLVIAHNSVVHATDAGFAEWSEWGSKVEAALRQARRPIFVQPPRVEVISSHIDTSRLERELSEIKFELWKQNLKSW
jgi:hypothetical protein